MHTPRLIQRATISRPLAPENALLSKAVDFDYMGSAEFEFGALPKSFRAIKARADDWKCRLVKEIVDKDRPLRVYSAFTDEEFEEYKSHLLKLRDGQLRTKESTYFDKKHEEHFKTLQCDFWWDIDNHVTFGFDKNFMNRLPHYVAASLSYMNEEKDLSVARDTRPTKT